jgi:hypothetical protein
MRLRRFEIRYGKWKRKHNCARLDNLDAIAHPLYLWQRRPECELFDEELPSFKGSRSTFVEDIVKENA